MSVAGIRGKNYMGYILYDKAIGKNYTNLKNCKFLLWGSLFKPCVFTLLITGIIKRGNNIPPRFFCKFHMTCTLKFIWIIPHTVH